MAQKDQFGLFWKKLEGSWPTSSFFFKGWSNLSSKTFDYRGSKHKYPLRYLWNKFSVEFLVVGEF